LNEENKLKQSINKPDVQSTAIKVMNYLEKLNSNDEHKNSLFEMLLQDVIMQECLNKQRVCLFLDEIDFTKVKT
jgi:hypothetical protein